jgi:prolipoprotein diacylglyceryl transferase
MPLFIPSPAHGVWYLGPIPIRGYAISILIGIIVAFVLSRRRWKTTGGDTEHFENLIFASILTGIIGARIYWVLIEWPRYFGENGTWYHIFYVWQGGLGIWGGITLGFLTALVLCRRYKISFLKVADCVAPGFLIAQGIGRLGNWWNQELYGLPTTLPWALEIDKVHRVAGFEQYATFHPTFLYEMLWNFAGAALLLILSRKLRIGSGMIFSLYIIMYALGRFWVELFRIDPVHVIAGLRINSWTTLVAGMVGVVVFVWALKHRKGTEDYSDDVGGSGPITVDRAEADSLGEIAP